MWWAKLVQILEAVYDGATSINVTLVGGAVGGQAVAQGDPNADATKGWPVRIFNASGALIGRLAAAASLPVALSNEDQAALDGVATQTTAAAILAKLIAAPATEAKQDTLLAAVKQLAGFETLTLISYGSGDQTNITDGSNGAWITSAGDLKFDTWEGASGVTLPVVPGLFPMRRLKKIYQTGSTAAGYIGYPPS